MMSKWFLVAVVVACASHANPQSYCDSSITPKAFEQLLFGDLHQISVKVDYHFYGHGVSEPHPTKRDGFHTQIECSIENEDTPFWQNLFSNQAEKITHTYPCDTNLIRPPRFTCGCAFLKIKMSFIRTSDTVFCNINNCDVKNGTFHFRHGETRYYAALRRKNVDSLIDYVKALLDRIIPRDYEMCGFD
jgi:hypothetical protein